jgi:hypothetical protein
MAKVIPFPAQLAHAPESDTRAEIIRHLMGRATPRRGSLAQEQLLHRLEQVVQRLEKVLQREDEG